MRKANGKNLESKPSEDWREEATKDIFGFMSKRT